MLNVKRLPSIAVVEKSKSPTRTSSDAGMNTNRTTICTCVLGPVLSRHRLRSKPCSLGCYHPNHPHLLNGAAGSQKQLIDRITRYLARRLQYFPGLDHVQAFSFPRQSGVAFREEIPQRSALPCQILFPMRLRSPKLRTLTF